MDPITFELLTSTAKTSRAIMEYLGFKNCGNYVRLNLDFGAFPNGSYAKV